MPLSGLAIRRCLTSLFGFSAGLAKNIGLVPRRNDHLEIAV
jgi:hypothetical protein